MQLVELPFYSSCIANIYSVSSTHETHEGVAIKSCCKFIVPTPVRKPLIVEPG